MKMKWEYDLPTDEKSNDYEYESPILVKEHNIYFLTTLNKKLQLHIVNDNTGLGKVLEISSENTKIPSKYFFIAYKEKIIIYAGEFFIYANESLSEFISFGKKQDLNHDLGSYILHENKLIFSFRSIESVLYCYNLDTLSLEWKISIGNSIDYRIGNPIIFQNMLACYGNDKLLFIDINNGSIVDELKLSRIDKLFYPIKMEDNQLLIGYTNWTTAGVVKYDPVTDKIIWKNKRSFQGPQTRCKIYKFKNLVYWVKNDTELICLDIEDGHEVYNIRTTPWLYTDLRIFDDNIIFGTAGRDGYINSINARNGKVNWSIFLKNGCSYYDIYNTSIFVGDFNKSIQKIDSNTGKILDTLYVDGEVVGQMKVYENCVYTVIWANSSKPIRLIKIENAD